MSHKFKGKTFQKELKKTFSQKKIWVQKYFKSLNFVSITIFGQKCMPKPILVPKRILGKKKL